MPQRPIDEFWRTWVRLRLANAGATRLSALKLMREAQRVAKALGRDDWPSDRTIRRLRDEYAKLTEAERRRYREFYWPEAMEDGSLPWEASASALELLALYKDRGRGRPFTSTVRWYWRLTQAMPPQGDADTRPVREQLARTLAALDLMGAGGYGVEEHRRAVEGFLVDLARRDAPAQLTLRIPLTAHPDVLRLLGLEVEIASRDKEGDDGNA